MLAYEIPPEQQARLDELIEIDTNSRLTAAQREELGDYRFVEDVLARVKVKIQQRLKRSSKARNPVKPKQSPPRTLPGTRRTTHD